MELITAAYMNVAVHVGSFCFLVALAASRKVREYFGGETGV